MTKILIDNSSGTATSFKLQTGNSYHSLGTVTNHPLVLVTNDTEAMRISAAGSVGIGNTSPTYKLDVTGDINSTTALRVSGTQVCTSAGCTAVSDRTLKEKIQPLGTSLDKILNLVGVEYDWKDKQKYGSRHQIGLIAQDLEKIYPEVVITDAKTGLKSVAYDHLIAPVIEAIKELVKEIAELKFKNQILEAKVKEIDDLKSKNEELEKKVSEIAVLKEQMKEFKEALKGRIK